MKNIQNFILYFCSIIQSFAIDQIEISTISEEINRDAFINKTHSLDHSNLIQISSTTQECVTLTGGCPGCPNLRFESEIFYSSKQLTAMSFKLVVLFLIIIWMNKIRIIFSGEKYIGRQDHNRRFKLIFEFGLGKGVPVSFSFTRLIIFSSMQIG